MPSLRRGLFSSQCHPLLPRQERQALADVLEALALC